MTVTKTADTNDGTCDADCSLREAVIAANAAPNADVIMVPAGTYVLTLVGADEYEAATGDLDVYENATIIGAGVDQTIVDGNASDRVFTVAAKVSFFGLTIRNGNAGDASGGGITNYGDLELAYSRLTGNVSEVNCGGGLYNRNDATTMIRSSTIDSNSAACGGAVGNHDLGQVTIVDSTLSDNTASDGGGAVENVDMMVLTNVTLSGNTAPDGGAIRTAGDSAGGTTVLNNVTIAENSASGEGDGLWTEEGGTVVLRNSILDDEAAGDDCDGDGDVVSEGHNLDSDGSCGLTGDGDQPNVDPKLGPLADNDGVTMTHALMAGSPAIDAGSDADCPPTDQRGFVRGAGDGCDAGAFEANSVRPVYAWGDIDCSGAADPVDALKLLRFDAGLSVAAAIDRCPQLGSLELIFEAARVWGDLDCSGTAGPIDALKTLRFDAGLSVSQPAECPSAGGGFVLG